jgi:acyl carrier protein/NAD(P)-dependent dehydrogenase (short-subunit alcohol dehydrogenase family)
MRPDLVQEPRTKNQEPVATAPTSAPTPAVLGSPVLGSPAGDEVADKVLAIVAEKTGYPPEMLDLDLDLEADLGVDTVKQAETFLAVREAFDIPRQDNLRLRDYPTLASVIGFVRTMRPDLVQEPRTKNQEPVATAPTSAPTPAVLGSPVLGSPAGDEVADKVLAIVAEKTGYPTEMLDLDLDLEADLGVDTVKQAETFLAVREAFAIPRQDNLRLRDYPTLASVIGFVRTMRPDLAVSSSQLAVSSPAAPVSPAPVAGLPSPVAPAGDPVTEKVLALVAEKTGYPTEMLDLDLDLEADLGVDTVKQAETFMAVREAFGIPRKDDLRLRDYPTLASVIQFVRDNRPDLAVRSRQSAVSSPAAPVSPAPVAGLPSPVAPAGDPVTEKVLALVAEKTGYPTEMLDLDLDLEADLGVDTVKQAETFMAVREAFGIPRKDDLRLRDYPTLASVIQFVRDNRPDLAVGSSQSAVSSPAAPLSPAPVAPAAAPVAPATIGSLADADTIARRVAVPALRPPLEFCKPTGIALGAGTRAIVAMDRGGIGKALVSRLEKRGVAPLVLEETPALEELETRIKGWLAEGPINGVYWLPALDVEPSLEELDLAGFRELTRQRIKGLFCTMRTLALAAEANQNQPRNPFLVSGTRLGGLHGYGSDGATAPLGGGVTGLTKSIKRERREALVKAVDFEPGRKTAEPAEALINETLFDPGIVEIGYRDGQRFTVTLEEQPAKDGSPGMELGKESVFVVTGAAGGITSAIVADLAANSGGIFYLLDLAPLPKDGDQNITLFRSDKEALKRKLIEDFKAAGEKPTPVMVDKKILTIEREEAALRAVEAVTGAGGTAHYHSVNLMDGPALAAVVDDIRSRYGKIDVLLHAGGIEISKSIESKEQREFDLVFDIKADGFFSLLNAAKGMPIGATVAFSSVAGRFGNSGQFDYSAANDFLCKVSSSFRNWRSDTRGIALDWTAWGGIGMATRGSIPKIMEMAGIDMLPPEAGVPTIRRELTYSSFKGEFVVGKRLGILVEEFDETGGLDTAKVEAWLKERAHPLLMLGSVKAAYLYGGLKVETTLDPQVQPFLFDHQLEGLPLLPGVMGTEAFAELATLLAPGYRIASISEEFSSPFKFYRNQPRTLYLSAIIKPGADGDLLAQTRLQSVTQPPKAELPPTIATHFVGNLRLTRNQLEQPVIDFTPPTAEDMPIERDRIYQIYFHGPAYQVLDRAQVLNGVAIGRMADQLPPNSVPAEAEGLVAPRLIEFCFQTAGIWEIATNGVMALPQAIESVTIYRQPEEANGQRLYALVEAVEAGKAFNARVVDEAGRVYLEMRGYHTVQLPGSVKL